CAGGDLRLVAELVKLDPLVVTNQYYNDFTALHIAAKWDQKEIVAFLLRKKARVNAKAVGGFTPLHLAAAESSEKVCEQLLDKGAKVKASTGAGDTPLHEAVRNNRLKNVVLLIKRKANVNAINVGGNPPLTYAENRDIKAVLLAAGAMEEIKGNK